MDPIKIVNLVQREANIYKLEGASILRVQTPLPSFQERLDFGFKLLEKLTPSVDAAA